MAGGSISQHGGLEGSLAGPFRNKGAAMTQQLCHMESAEEKDFNMYVHEEA